MFTTSVRHSLVKAPFLFFSSNASKLAGLHGTIAATQTRHMCVDANHRLHVELSKQLENQSKRVIRLTALLKKQALGTNPDRMEVAIINLGRVAANLHSVIVDSLEGQLRIGNQLFIDGYPDVAADHFEKVIQQGLEIPQSLDFRVPVMLSLAYHHKALSLIASCSVDGKNLTDEKYRLGVMDLVKESLYYNSDNKLADALLKALNTPGSLVIGSYEELQRVGDLFP